MKNANQDAILTLVDSHCHLNLLPLSENEDIKKIIERAHAKHVHYFLNVCVSLTEFENVLNTAKQFPEVFASVGLHPAETNESVDELQLMLLAKHPKVIAIGETGLDYFHCKDKPQWQRERFALHMRVARELKKPLIIHTRDAKSDTLMLMKEERADLIGGVMHCFTEDWEMAEAVLEMGFYISFSGIVTFRNARQIQEVALRTPLDRILIETDAPYLAPDPYRGKTNFPEYVVHTAEYLAKLRGISLLELAQQTTHNFFHLFKGAARV